MADTALPLEAGAKVNRPSLLKRIILHNLPAKIAALPMMVTVLVVFVGCTLWTIYYSFTNSKLLPTGKFVGIEQYERLFATSRWNVSVTNLITYGVLSLRSEEHTSELQSRENLVCRLLLEKKK